MSIRSVLATIRGHRVPSFNIVGRRAWWFAFSGLLIALSLVGLFARGLNFSIAFTGGALLEFPDQAAEDASVDERVGDFADVMGEFGLGSAQVEILGGNRVSIRTETLTDLEDEGEALRAALAEEAGIDVGDINVTDVGPTWGSTISRKAVIGLIVFLVLVSLYITLRFEWKMAVGALVALFHDLIITAGVYALVGREVTPETVIAILTILGYSLYDTVVIYDKVKENTESAALVARETYSGVVNLSLNQVLMRSVNTSLVVLLPIAALLLFGGETLKDFAFALLVGVAIGAYSSIFIAAPLLGMLKERETRFRQIRARAEQRAARPGLRTVPPSPGLAAVGDGDGEVEQVRAAAGTRASPARKPGATRVGSTASKKKKRPQGKPKPRRR